MAVAMAGVAVMVVPGTGASAGAGYQLDLDDLPATVRIGDTLTISGSGCVDLATGSGTGRAVQLQYPQPFGGIDLVPAAADGTFDASFTITEPVVDGPADLEFSCTDAEQPGEVLDPRSREVAPVTVVGASLDVVPAAARIGDTITVRSPCTFDQSYDGGPGSLDLDLVVDGDRLPLEVTTASSELGDRLSAVLPGDAGLVPGPATVQAACFPYRSPVSARSAPSAITLLAAGTAAPAPAPSPAPAPAAPVPGDSTYTG